MKKLKIKILILMLSLLSFKEIALACDVDIFKYCCIIGLADGGKRRIYWNSDTDYVACDVSADGKYTFIIYDVPLNDLIKPCQVA
jgi:hypothetical protein